MDPLTQGALGAAASVGLARPARVRTAALLGGLSGMAPDLDVLIRSSKDPLVFLEYHRQFTHSLIFIPFGGFLCAIVLFPFVRRTIAFRNAYAYCCLGYATHGLLDACTSYGTQLLWPFSSLRVAWNNISIIDPLLTLPLLAFLLFAVARRSIPSARVGLIWVLGYLALGVVQRERAESVGWQIAEKRDHTPASVAAKPSFGNLLLWKTIYEYEGIYYVDAVRVGRQPIVFEGDRLPALDIRRDFPWLQGKIQQRADIERFRWFSDGYIARDPNDSRRIIDIRYSFVPNRIEALWGLELSPERSSTAHSHFFTERQPTAEHRAELLRLLWSSPPGETASDDARDHSP